jgi:hypothetical protein
VHGCIREPGYRRYRAATLMGVAGGRQQSELPRYSRHKRLRLLYSLALFDDVVSPAFYSRRASGPGYVESASIMTPPPP